MATITTHILNTAIGKPADGVDVALFVADSFTPLAHGKTDADGRLKTLTPTGVAAGTYRLRFDVAPYFEKRGEQAFYPYCDITFVIVDDQQHFHVPLLLQPFGFSTYRGS